MTDDLHWRRDCDHLAAYFMSRRTSAERIVSLLTWALATSARSLSESDEQTAAAIAHLAGQMERMAGLPPATRQ